MELAKLSEQYKAQAEAVTDRWENLERSCLHAERLKDEGLPFHCILSLRGFIAEAIVIAAETLRQERDEARAVIGRLTDEAIISEFGRTAALSREAALREALAKAASRIEQHIANRMYGEQDASDAEVERVIERDPVLVAARAALRVEVAPAEEPQDGSHEPAIGSGSISRPKDGSR